MFEEGGPGWKATGVGSSGIVKVTPLSVAQETRFLSRVVGLDIRQRSHDGRGVIISFSVGRLLVAVGELPPFLSERNVTADVTVVGLTLDDLAPPLTVNGHIHTMPTVLLSHRGTYDCIWYASPETVARRTASVVFPGDNAARGWPTARDLSLIIPVRAAALASLRRLVRDAMEIAAGRPERMAVAEIVAQMEADFYAAVDRVVLTAERPRAPDRIDGYAARLRDLLRDDDACRLRSGDIAAELGVSPRTLNAISNALFGLSPHQYLKLRRLYRVKESILAGGSQVLVKQCALSFGFWHLGQFARDYWLAFGETPAQTLRRTRSR